LDQMLAAHKREQDLEKVIASRSTDFESRKVSIQSELRQIAQQAEGAIAKGEDEAKVQVQTGIATIDKLGDLVSDVVTELFPALQTAHRLGTQLELLERAVKVPAALEDFQHLAAVESDTRTAFKTSAFLLRRLSGRLRDPDGKRRIASLRAEYEGLEAAVVGSDGLLSMQRRLIAARAGLTNGRQTLDDIERAYLQPLEQVRYQAGQLNEAARRQSVEASTQGRAMVGGSILMTVFLSLAFGLILSRRLTAPLIRLTAQAAAIRETGELRELADITSRRRRDEIGILGQSLNAMIAELAEARRTLVAWSEAEIRKQYERLQAAIHNMPQGLCMFDSDRRLIVLRRTLSARSGTDRRWNFAGCHPWASSCQQCRRIGDRELCGGAPYRGRRERALVFRA
jgi:HAMP domain-containing protein